jgi:hypothetical protein
VRYPGNGESAWEVPPPAAQRLVYPVSSAHLRKDSLRLEELRLGHTDVARAGRGLVTVGLNDDRIDARLEKRVTPALGPTGSADDDASMSLRQHSPHSIAWLPHQSAWIRVAPKPVTASGTSVRAEMSPASSRHPYGAPRGAEGGEEGRSDGNADGNHRSGSRCRGCVGLAPRRAAAFGGRLLGVSGRERGGSAFRGNSEPLRGAG